MKRGIKNLLLSLIGFSAAPMLTACYGSPYDDYDPDSSAPFTEVEGYVVSTEMTPIKGIKVSVNGLTTTTDDNGHFLVESPDYPMYNTKWLRAEDIDGYENGGYYGEESVEVTSENHSIVSVVMTKHY